MKKNFIFKKLSLATLLLVAIIWVVACSGGGNASKTWTVDSIIRAFGNKGITIDNQIDAKGSVGEVNGLKEAVGFTSGDIAGIIITLDSSNELNEAKKQLESVETEGYKVLTNGNALVMLFKGTGTELTADESKNFEDSLK